MGHGMNGLEARIEFHARQIAEQFDEITYVEIGVAEGTTLSAIGMILKESGKKWRAIGVELPNGYSFSRERTQQVAAQRHLVLDFVTPNCSIVHPPWNVVTVYFKDSQTFLTEFWQEPIHFALIDGCHGKPCVITDFIAVEAFAADGAVVMFHDFNIEQRGMSQPHCRDGCDVYGACQELGLLSGNRAGWKMLEVATADRAIGGWDMGLFKKTKVEKDA
jgi:hypothetical protein